MVLRKERVHHHGHSNRTVAAPHATCHGATAKGGPVDFDATMRSTRPRNMVHKSDIFVPLTTSGIGHGDFTAKLPGHDYRQPGSDKAASRRLRSETSQALSESASRSRYEMPSQIAALSRIGLPVDEDQPREEKQRGQEAALRWNPAKWWEASTEARGPLMKEEGEAWNSQESQHTQGTLKGQDRLLRATRSRADVASPDTSARRPFDDPEEYYPGRSSIDGTTEDPINDFALRPAHLPDFGNPPPETNSRQETVNRMQRLREVLKQRYAGRPRLINTFRNCTLKKAGYVFPLDLQQIFDQMGINVTESECAMLVNAVDKDSKNAVTFEEFADLIYGPDIRVGSSNQAAQERHIRHVTRTLVDGLIPNSMKIGRAFAEIDPQRNYMISKAQFANALGTACNHLSEQAISFLWSSQIPANSTGPSDDKCIDWRSFMSQLAHFANDNRPPTPCVLQDRKHQYDLLQRSVAVTGGELEDVDLSRPDQCADDEVQIVCDKLVYRHVDMPHKPRDVSMLAEPYVEVIRGKAFRVQHALPRKIKKARMKELLKDRALVHQDELMDVLCKELAEPGVQEPVRPQEPLYASGLSGQGDAIDVMTLDPKTLGEACLAASGPPEAEPELSGLSGFQPGDGAQSLRGPPGVGEAAQPPIFRLTPADVQAYIATHRTNRDCEIDVQAFLEAAYKPEHERKAMDVVNDGLNRHLRGVRPARERPPKSVEPRHENYWQARYMMEAIADSIANVEKSNGGKLKSSKIFKRIDIDGDGYLTLSDLRNACEKYNVPNATADLHALFSELDKADNGSVDIGEFTRHFELYQGSLLDSMSRPVAGVYHEGGVHYAGELQEKLDARERELEAADAANNAAHEAKKERVGSAPPAGRPEQASPLKAASPPEPSPSSARSRKTGISAVSADLPQITEVPVGKGRVSDVMRARYSKWKPIKSEIYTAPAATRFGMTVFADTRHVVEPSVPGSAAFMSDAERFTTTAGTFSVFTVPDHKQPQAADSMRKHARNEFRVERIKSRQLEFAQRCWAANQAAQDFDEKKIARKAITQLDYERRVRMACA